MRVAMGSDPDGHLIALIDNQMRVRIQRSSVTDFEVGDKIGWSPDTDHWRGTIIISEPDTEALNPGCWHLAWTVEREPNRIEHWRGESTVRDSRWYMPNPYVIHETP